MLRFEDVDGESANISSVWKRSLRERQVNRRVQAGPVQTHEVAVQSVTYAEADVQTQDLTVSETEGKHNEELDETKDNYDENNNNAENFDRDLNKDAKLLSKWLSSARRQMENELRRNDHANMSAAVPSAEPAPSVEAGHVFCTITRPSGSVEDADELACTSVSWNATGSQVIASFGRFDSFGWCAHRGSVCLWNVFHKEPEELETSDPDFRFTVECGVMCVQGHPTRPSVVAAGTFNGEILILDFNQEDPLVACSRIEAYCHREPVMMLRWIPHKAGESDHMLASISAEGRVLFWSPEGDMLGPLQGVLLASESRAARTLGGIAFDICQQTSSATGLTAGFIAGTEAGGLCRCTMRNMPDLAAGSKARASLGVRTNKWTTDAQDILLAAEVKDRAVLRSNAERYAEVEGLSQIDTPTVYEASGSENFMFKSGIRFKYTPHVGPVHAVACSPFHRNAFLSCGADGHLRIYSLLERAPVLDFEPQMSATHALFSAAWSPHRPAVFAACSSSGHVYVYDLSQSTDAPVTVLQGSKEKETALHSLSFNKRTRGFVATGDASGCIRILKLSWRLANRQPVDKSALDLTMYQGTKKH